MFKNSSARHSREEVRGMVEKFVTTAREVHGESYLVGYLSSMVGTLIINTTDFEHDVTYNQLKNHISDLHETSHNRLMRERKAA